VLRVLSAAAAKLRDFARLEGGGTSTAAAGTGGSSGAQNAGKYKLLDGFPAQNRRL
jgi:hypothetical protein